MNAGRIITFYSYKGGTGRSMALANVAWILASNGKKVLVLDWDLEAPGLHRYLAPFLRDKDLTASDGLIDFVIKFATAAAKPSEELSEKERSDESWFLPYANILRYATSIDWKFDHGGTIDFIPAGRQGPSYSTRVNSFNWQFFYDRLGGGILLERAKDRMRAEYDYILIDSRTGVSDTSGICTVQMPDDLVVCFTLNNQSIEGAAAVARSVHEQRTAGGKPVDIFPVATRVESGEKGKLEARKALARERFRGLPLHLGPEERERYWGEAQVSYVPYYAYEEILACFGDNFTDRFSVLAACEQITFYVTRHEVAKLVPPSGESRSRVLLEYEGGAALDRLREQEQFAESVLGRFSSEDNEFVPHVLTRLVRVPGLDEIGGPTPRWAHLEEIEDPAAQVIQSLVSAGLLVHEGERIRIADGALIEGWPRLGKWIERDRAFLLWRQQLQGKITDWLREKRGKRLLLSGPSLQEASHWLQTYGDRFNKSEHSYLRESIKGEMPKAAWNWRWIAGLAILVVVALLTLKYPPQIEYLVESKELPQDSWVFSEDRSVAVALSESEPAIVLRAEDSWNEMRRIPISFGSMRVSPKGRYLAGITEDGGLYVWSSRRPLRAESNPVAHISSNDQEVGFVDFGFSPDEKWAYVLANSRLFFVNTEKASNGSPGGLREIAGNTTEVLLSPKGSYAAVRDGNGDLALLELPSGRIKVRLSLRTGTSIDFVYRHRKWAFSQDEKWLGVAQNGEISLLDTATARQRKKSFSQKLGYSSDADFLFSPDGDWLFFNTSEGFLGLPVKTFPDGQRVISDEGHALAFDPLGNWVAGRVTGSLKILLLAEG